VRSRATDPLACVQAGARRLRKVKLRLEQAIELRWRGGRDDDGIGCAARRVYPVGRRQAQAFLQHKTRRRWHPRNRRIARRGRRNGEPRGTHNLHGLGQNPEATRDGELSVRHRSTGIRLADGAADGIHTPLARAATAVNGVPVDRVGLRGGIQRSHDESEETEEDDLRFHVGLLNGSQNPVRKDQRVGFRAGQQHGQIGRQSARDGVGGMLNRPAPLPVKLLLTLFNAIGLE
jgi:hypothetical protein